MIPAPYSLRALLVALAHALVADSAPAAKRLAGRALRWGQVSSLRAWVALGVAAERVDPAKCWTCKERPMVAGGLTCAECRAKVASAAPTHGDVNAPGGSS